MLSNKVEKLELKPYTKSNKMAYIIYADIGSLIKKIDGSENNPEKSLRAKICQHISYWYSIPTIRGFNHIEDKHT